MAEKPLETELREIRKEAVKRIYSLHLRSKIASIRFWTIAP